MYLSDELFRDGEVPEEWPQWYKIREEPLLTTEFGVRYSYVVLPQEGKWTR